MLSISRSEVKRCDVKKKGNQQTVMSGRGGPSQGDMISSRSVGKSKRLGVNLGLRAKRCDVHNK